MESYQVDILNTKAVKLLKDLADLKLISISNSSTDSFLVAVNKLRKNAASNAPNIRRYYKRSRRGKS